LVTYKRPVSVAEAFRDLPFRLTMVGVGPLEASVRAVKPPNVQLRGWLHERELADLFSSATGFLHVGEEDFGMSMVEALAAGTPVIGLRAGGALDIVRPGADGILIDDASLDSIRAAVHEVAARRWDPTALAQRAERFSSARFRMRFAAHVEQSLRVRRD
jgi:glycosyltransferase involved in cell wall biosynthesis